MPSYIGGHVIDAIYGLKSTMKRAQLHLGLVWGDCYSNTGQMDYACIYGLMPARCPAGQAEGTVRDGL